MRHLTPENNKVVHKEVLAAIQVDEGSECDIGEKRKESKMSESTTDCLMESLLGQFSADSGQEQAADSEMQSYVKSASFPTREGPLG